MQCSSGATRGNSLTAFRQPTERQPLFCEVRKARLLFEYRESEWPMPKPHSASLAHRVMPVKVNLFSTFSGR